MIIGSGSSLRQKIFLSFVGSDNSGYTVPSPSGDAVLDFFDPFKRTAGKDFICIPVDLSSKPVDLKMLLTVFCNNKARSSDQTEIIFDLYSAFAFFLPAGEVLFLDRCRR